MGSFDKYSNYNENTSYSSIVFGSDKPLLEVELNELQQILNAKLNRVAKSVFGTSSFTLLKEDSVKFNESTKMLEINDCVAIANNGYIAYVTSVKVSFADITTNKLVYVQLQEVEKKYDDTIYNYGNSQSDKVVTNTMKDSRSPDETTRRKVVIYSVKIGNYVPLDNSTVKNIHIGNWNAVDSSFKVNKSNRIDKLESQLNGISLGINEEGILYIEAPNEELKCEIGYILNGEYIKGNPDVKLIKSIGNTFTFKANVTGGSEEGYLYNFCVYNTDTGKEHNFDYQNLDTLEWESTTPGNRKFYVYVQDSSGRVTRSYNSIFIQSTDKLSVKVELEGLTDTPDVGDAITIKPIVTGGTGSYKWRYQVKNVTTGAVVNIGPAPSSDFKSVVEPYSSSFTSSGTKQFLVWVSDSNGEEVLGASEVVTVKDPLYASLTINGSSEAQSLKVGSDVTLSVEATGGSEDYRYTHKVYVGGSWVVLANNSTDPTYTTSPGTTGVRIYVTEVSDSEGRVVQTNTIEITITN